MLSDGRFPSKDILATKVRDCVNERDWAAELEDYLQARYTDLCAVMEQPAPGFGIRIKPPLGREESKQFLLGLEAGLFRLDENGCAESELLPYSSHEGDSQKSYQIFWSDPAPIRLCREGVCQLATAAALILKRGWLRNQIEMQPGLSEQEGMAGCGVDILVKSLAGRILVCVVVKRTAEELQKLSVDFRQCCRRGSHAKSQCAFEQNHAKYEFCIMHQPAYFWAVAPDLEICFRIAYATGALDLEELSSLPARSMIELE